MLVLLINTGELQQFHLFIWSINKKWFIEGLHLEGDEASPPHVVGPHVVSPQSVSPHVEGNHLEWMI